jgi:hypothetical protein
MIRHLKNIVITVTVDEDGRTTIVIEPTGIEPADEEFPPFIP